jgi:uncharacterized protein YlxP (DUF503 family)
MIFNFKDFCLFEARKDKKSLVDTVVKLLGDKPQVKVGETTYKDVYSTAAIKQYFKNNDLSAQNADDALYSMQSDKNLKKIQVKDFKNNSTYPCYYMDLTSEEAQKHKEKLEKDSKERAKPELEKRAEVRKKAALSRSTTRKTTTKK